MRFADGTFAPITWERLCALAVGSLLVLVCLAQVINEDALRKVPLPQRPGVIAGLEAMPDGHTIAVGFSKDGGVVLIDTNGWRIVSEIPVHGFPDGPRLSASADGRFLLMKNVGRLTAEGRRDMKGEQAVLDVPAGRILLDGGLAEDGAMSADGSLFATLEGDKVTVRGLPDGAVRRIIPVPNATNAIAISPDGLVLAVSHRPAAEQLMNVPSVRNDKKGLKGALKFRQMVSLYTLKDGHCWKTVNEVYDIIRSMAFTPDGARLLIYSSADPRSRTSAGGLNDLDFTLADRPGHVEQVDARAGEPMRTGFMCRMNEPFLAAHPASHTIALSSTEGHNKRKLLLFDTETGETRAMIDLAQKHRYDVDEGEEHDGREPYCWLPDGRLLLALGDNLAIWKP